MSLQNFILLEHLVDRAHQHTHEHTHDLSSNIQMAFYLNLGFTLLEIFGGLWTNSVAILSDAIHDLGDSLSLGLAWLLDRYAQRERDKRFSYGYRRFSLLGALVNTIVLIVGAIFVLSEAIPRLFNPEPSNVPGMIVFALIGIAANGAAVLRLRGSKTLNAQVVAWHLLEDVLGWIAVLIVAVVLLFTDIQVLDPALSILITAYVLFNVFRNMRKTLRSSCKASRSTSTWSTSRRRSTRWTTSSPATTPTCGRLDGEHHVLTTHVVVDEGIAVEQILCVKEDIKNLLKPYQLSHITVEIEYGERDCAMNEHSFRAPELLLHHQYRGPLFTQIPHRIFSSSAS